MISETCHDVEGEEISRQCFKNVNVTDLSMIRILSFNEKKYKIGRLVLLKSTWILLL